KLEGPREGVAFSSRTGIDEPGAALLLDPASPDPEVLFLRPLDVERGQWEGERAKLPSQLLQTTSGIPIIRRGGDNWRGLSYALIRACGHGRPRSPSP